MKLKTKKIPIEISVEGKYCNNCYWMDVDCIDKDKIRCLLFTDVKLKGNWKKGFKRCKECMKTFK